MTTERLLFQDVAGQPVRFFLQRDVPNYAWLCEEITELGGRVEEKVPRCGFVLLNPGSDDANRLRECWEDLVERPGRFFVPYTYIHACRAEGQLLRQCFILGHRALKFYIPEDLPSRDVVCSQILHSGGDVDAEEPDADVVITDCPKPRPNIPHNFRGRVESVEWVQACIRTGSAMFSSPDKKTPDERRSARERIAFTESDDRHLCEWIAAKLPFKASGGRLGNRLYQELMEKAEHPDYSWVKRHTWSSWRERYKKNSVHLNHIVEHIVEECKFKINNDGQYNDLHVRPCDIPAEGESSELHRLAGGSLRLVDTPPSFSLAGSHIHPTQALAALEPVQHTPFPHSSSGAQDRPSSNRDPPLEDVVCESDGLPPSRVKRARCDDPEENAKKQRTEDVSSVIQAIAREFRFTGEEVQEYFDIHRDVDKTRKRFQRMREHLAKLGPLE